MKKVIIITIVIIVILIYYYVRLNYERGINPVVLRTEIGSILDSPIQNKGHLRKIGGELPSGYNYNPGLIVWNRTGGYSYYLRDPLDVVLITFRNARITPLFFTKSYMGRLDMPTGDVSALRKTSTADMKHEDMRFFSFDGRLCGSFTKTWSSINPFNTYLLNKQAIYDFNKEREYLPRLNYAISEGRFEKNWQYFQDGEDYLMVYMIQPFTVYRVNPETYEAEEKIREIDWKCKNGMRLRCSTPPVWVVDRWYMVAHTKDYRIHIITFNKQLEPMEYTSSAICEGVRCTYSIYFPCGCIWDETNNKFILSLGVNNTYLATLDVPMSEVRSKMEYIG